MLANIFHIASHYTRNNTETYKSKSMNMNIKMQTFKLLYGHISYT